MNPNPRDLPVILSVADGHTDNQKHPYSSQITFHYSNIHNLSMLTKISSQIIVGCFLADASNENFASQTNLISARFLTQSTAVGAHINESIMSRHCINYFAPSSSMGFLGCSGLG
jgi:hypothetical protein